MFISTISCACIQTHYLHGYTLSKTSDEREREREREKERDKSKRLTEVTHSRVGCYTNATKKVQTATLQNTEFIYI